MHVCYRHRLPVSCDSRATVMFPRLHGDSGHRAGLEPPARRPNRSRRRSSPRAGSANAARSPPTVPTLTQTASQAPELTHYPRTSDRASRRCLRIAFPSSSDGLLSAYTRSGGGLGEQALAVPVSCGSGCFEPSSQLRWFEVATVQTGIELGLCTIPSGAFWSSLSSDEHRLRGDTLGGRPSRRGAEGSSATTQTEPINRTTFGAAGTD